MIRLRKIDHVLDPQADVIELPQADHLAVTVTNIAAIRDTTDEFPPPPRSY